jgi:isopentenyl-diphosphate delta-isomerase
MTVDLSLYDAEQQKLMGEMCIVVDKNDNALKSETKKNCHLMENIKTGLLHRAFSVFIFNPEGKLLLQQRASEKITFPEYFTNTCCSHPLFTQEELEGELGAKHAAIRKLEQELGITDADINGLQFLTKIHYEAPSDDIWGEHEIDYIFIYQGNVTCKENPNEVKSLKYVTKEELKDMMRDKEKLGIKITPWFDLIAENFLFKWWDQLSDLSVFKDQDVIHRL